MADWLTDGGDPQRTAWQKNEHILNVSNGRVEKRLQVEGVGAMAEQVAEIFTEVIVAPGYAEGALDVLGINDYFGWYNGPRGTISDRRAVKVLKLVAASAVDVANSRATTIVRDSPALVGSVQLMTLRRLS